MKIKRFIVLILVISLLTSMMVSCSKKDKTSKDESEASTQDLSSYESEDGSIDDTTDDAIDDMSDDTSYDKKEDSDVSEDVSTPNGDNSSSDASEDTSSDDKSNDADFSDLLGIHTAYDGHKIGDWLNNVFDFEKGFDMVLVDKSEPDSEDTFRLAIKGQNLLMDVCSYFEGEAYEEIILAKDGIFHILNPEEMTYIALGDMEDFLFDETLEDDYEVEFLKTEEKEKDGVKYTVEVFKGRYGDGEEDTEEFYFLGDELKWVYDGYSFIQVKDYKVGISDDVFDIPEGYEELKQPGIEDIVSVPEEYKDLAIGKVFSKLNSKDGYAITQKNTDEDIYDGEYVRTEMATTLTVKGEKLSVEIISIGYDKDGEIVDEFRKSIIFKDSKLYDINHEEKEYYVEDMNLLFGGALDRFMVFNSDYKYIKTETKNVKGVEYTVDVFEYGEEDFMGAEEIKFCTLNGELKYIDFETEVEITEGKNIDDSVFEVPSDYVLKDYYEDFPEFEDEDLF